MHRVPLAVLTVLGALALAAPAQAAADKAAALKRELGPGVRVAAHAETGQVRFVAAGRGAAIPSGAARGASAPEAARAFLRAHGTAFGIADPARELRVESNEALRPGRSTVRFQQLRGGLPVLGGELVVNLDRAGDVVSASGELEPGSVGTAPEVGAEAARQQAIAAVAKYRDVSAVRLDAATPQKWIFDARLLGGPGPQHATLAWRVEVKGDSGLAIDDLVLVDASRGGVLVRIPQIEEAINREVCDNNGASTLPCTPGAAVRSEGEGPTGNADVDAAYDHAEEVYDYYLGHFGRESLDDNDMTLLSTVDFCNGPCPFDNAFWNGTQMVYGEGWPLGDDLVGHEMTHGVTDFTASLFYYMQSGAINESLSDVFGELIDLENGPDPAGDRWQVFEDIPGGPLRDMQNPAFTPTGGLPSPDRMTSPNYFFGEGDQGGVHFNSGVNNHAAYLMTDGEVGSGVTGIGTAKVGGLYYDVLTTLLTSGSDYADLASALGQACDDLVGTEGFTAGDCTEVRDAIAAVEMTANPPNAPAPQAPVCPAGQIATNVFSDNMEGSLSSWFASDLGRWGARNDYAHSGIISLFGVDSATTSDSHLRLTNSVQLPAGRSSFLRFDHAYGFEDDGGGTYDGGVLEISVDGGAFVDVGSLLTDVPYTGTIAAGFGNPLAGRAAFTGESNGYRASRVTLTSLAGRDVNFRWRIGTDSTNPGTSGPTPLGWFIDDVRIYTCAAPPPPPDSDGDGVPDASDSCPSTPGTLPNGCAASPPAPPVGGGTPTGPPSGGTPSGGNPLASARVRSCKRTGKGRRARVRCTLAGAGAVTRATVTVKRGRKTVAKKTLRPAAGGVLSIKPKGTLRKGTYKVTIVIRDAAGDKRTLKKTFKIR
jgi:Zn-dependent metalloprotease